MLPAPTPSTSSSGQPLPGSPAGSSAAGAPAPPDPNLPATASGGAAHRTLLVKPDMLTPEGIAALIQRAREVRRFRKAFAHLRPKRA